MKKLLSILFIFLYFSSFGQVVTRTYDILYPNGLFGQKQIDTIYTLPRTPLMYFNGYGNFVNLRDTVRTFFSVDTSATSGGATYNSTTGVFNIPKISAGGGTALSSITAAVATNTIDNLAYKQKWNWSTLANDTAIALYSSGNTTSTTQSIFSVKSSGTTGTSGFSTAASFENIKTGSNNSNAAITASASGGTYNPAIYVPAGFVGIGTNQPAYDLNISRNNTGNIGALIQNTNSGANAQALLGLRNSSSNTGYVIMQPNAASSSGMSAPNQLMLQSTFPIAINETDTFPFKIGTNAVERIRVIGINGALGIGAKNYIQGANFNDSSTTEGMLFPRMTTSQRDSLIGGFTGTLTGGSGYTNGNYKFSSISILGGSGRGVQANIVVAGGIVTSFYLEIPGTGYKVNDSLYISGAGIGGGTGFYYKITAITPPATGLLIYNTTMQRINTYNGSAWVYSSQVSTGTAAPATTPFAVGDEFVDTSGKKIYFATGTSSSSDWTITN